MTTIPEEILSRLTFRKRGRHDEHNLIVSDIQPLEACDCGCELESKKHTWIKQCGGSNTRHWREHCGVCRRVREVGTQTWYSVEELNRIIRSRGADPTKDK